MSSLMALQRPFGRTCSLQERPAAEAAHRTPASSRSSLGVAPTRQAVSTAQRAMSSQFSAFCGRFDDLAPLLAAPCRSLLTGPVAAQQDAASSAEAATPSPSRPTFAHSAAAADPARGAELGLATDFEERFAEGALLGVGSFGTVHAATCRASGREVAVKKLRKDLPRGLHPARGTGRISRQKLLKRLRREIDTLRALDGCASTIGFEGAFETESHVFLVMDVCHGGDLETLLKACGALGERHAAMVVWEVLRLVRACHSAGILHGDIKPSNFLLAPGNPLCPVPLPPAAAGRGKDTGAARPARRDIAAELAEAEAAGLHSFSIDATSDSSSNPAAAPSQPPFCPLPTADASASDLHVPYAGGWLKGVDFGCSHEAPPGVTLTKMTGTPAFMAPEVFARRFGTQADMWSLGILAYQTLSDRLPFWQSEDDMRLTSMTDVRSAVDEPIPLDYGPWLAASPKCRDFVTRLLQHDPAQRLTAEQASDHPWFALHGISEPPTSEAAPAAPVTHSNIVPAEDMATRAVLQRSLSSEDLASQAALAAQS